jgi:hypothetical protein
MIENLLNKLGLTQPSIDEIQKITLFLNDAQNAVRLYINSPIIPDELNFIVEEMAIKRYRMVGSEHLNSETIGNVSFSYSEGLTEYKTFLDQHKIKSGKLRAL